MLSDTERTWELYVVAYFSVLTKYLAAEDEKHNKTTLSEHSAPKPRLELGTSPVLQLDLCSHALAHDVTLLWEATRIFV